MILFCLPYNRNSQCFHYQTDECRSRWWVRYPQVPQWCVGYWCWDSLGKQTGIFQLWYWLQVFLTFLYPLQPLPVREEKDRVSSLPQGTEYSVTNNSYCARLFGKCCEVRGIIAETSLAEPGTKAQDFNYFIFSPHFTSCCVCIWYFSPLALSKWESIGQKSQSNFVVRQVFSHFILCT